MSATAVLSSRFRISVPEAVRKEQHWAAGQEWAFIPKGMGVLLIPVPELGHLAGIAKVVAKGTRTESYRDRRDRY